MDAPVPAAPAPIDRDLIPADVIAICRRLQTAGHQAHLVGGGVRDLVLGRQPKDFDLATSAHPDAVMALFGHRFAIPTGLQHGTVTVLSGPPPAGRPVEVTTFRGEGVYLDGRRPSSVEFGKTLIEDLARRDFTMNAIAYDPIADADGKLTDPFGGQQDLAARLVRAVGDPRQRFAEDGLRPMRAVRQATQLGFAIDPPTLQAIPATLASFRKVSAERIRDELLKLLAAPAPERGIELLRASGLLAEVIPELLEGVGCAQNRFHKFDVYGHTVATLAATRSTDPILRLGALLHDVGKPRAQAPKPDAPGEFSFFKHEHIGAEMAVSIGQRLKLATAERESVRLLVANHMFYYTPEWTDGSVRRFVRRVGIEELPALLALREADVAGRGFGEDPDKETAELRRRIELAASADAALTVKDLALNGRDVMQLLAVPPSKVIGVVLEALLERVLDDPGLNTRDRLAQLVPEVAATVAAPRGA
jgi:tRNA nucleotidyltransferase (CCA-adding enzyme)